MTHDPVKALVDVLDAVELEENIAFGDALRLRLVTAVADAHELAIASITGAAHDPLGLLPDMPGESTTQRSGR